MSLPNAKIKVTNDWPTNKGWYFGVLGPIPDDGSDPLKREQFEDPIFTRNYVNAYFEPDVVYFFYPRHPVEMADPEYVRVKFNEAGGYTVLSPEEVPGTPGVGAFNVVSDNDIRYLFGRLCDLFPALRYTLGLGVIKPLGDFSAAEFDPDEFETTPS